MHIFQNIIFFLWTYQSIHCFTNHTKYGIYKKGKEVCNAAFYSVRPAYEQQCHYDKKKKTTSDERRSAGNVWSLLINRKVQPITTTLLQYASRECKTLVVELCEDKTTINYTYTHTHKQWTFITAEKFLWHNSHSMPIHTIEAYSTDTLYWQCTTHDTKQPSCMSSEWVLFENVLNVCCTGAIGQKHIHLIDNTYASIIGTPPVV